MPTFLFVLSTIYILVKNNIICYYLNVSGEEPLIFIERSYMDLNIIKNDLTNIISNNGFILYDICFESNLLKIIIDKKGFLDISELELCTNLINEYLDKTDPIDSEYNLEVESRGIEKDISFDDSNFYLGETIAIKTFDQLHKGKLVKKESDSLTIKTNKNKEIKINANDIEKINIVVEL